MADKAREWGVNICYSAYSARRTGCRDYFLNTPEQLATLNRELDRVEARRDSTNWIVNSPTTLEATRSYFENNGAAGLQSRPALPGGDRRRSACSRARCSSSGMRWTTGPA